MEAVTVISPGYEAVGYEAVRRFEHFASCEGLPIRVTILKDQAGKASYARKLDMEQFAGKGKTIVFFDADYWPIRPLDLSSFHDRAEIIGVKDHGFSLAGCFPNDDCVKFQMDPDRYINTGFFIFNDRHREVWAKARELMEAGGMSDHGEQSYLNRAIQSLGIPQYMLPIQFNFWKFLVDWGGLPFIPRGIIGLHGAGIPAAEKFRQMSLQAQVFETPQAPLCPAEWEKIHVSEYEHKSNLLPEIQYVL